MTARNLIAPRVISSSDVIRQRALAMGVADYRARRPLAPTMRFRRWRAITPDEWAMVAPELEAIAAIEGCIGRPAFPTLLLDGVIDSGVWRQHAQEDEA